MHLPKGTRPPTSRRRELECFAPPVMADGIPSQDRRRGQRTSWRRPQYSPRQPGDPSIPCALFSCERVMLAPSLPGRAVSLPGRTATLMGASPSCSSNHPLGDQCGFEPFLEHLVRLAYGRSRADVDARRARSCSLMRASRASAVGPCCDIRAAPASDVRHEPDTTCVSDPHASPTARRTRSIALIPMNGTITPPSPYTSRFRRRIAAAPSGL